MKDKILFIEILVNDNAKWNIIRTLPYIPKKLESDLIDGKVNCNVSHFIDKKIFCFKINIDINTLKYANFYISSKIFVNNHYKVPTKIQLDYKKMYQKALRKEKLKIICKSNT